jgi:hypothetical protein
MNPLLLILALAATTSASKPTPSEQDLAGNRLEAFAPRPDLMKPDGPPLLCTVDERWCAEISRDVDSDESELHVFAGLPTGGQPVVLHALTRTDDEELALWPRLIRLAGLDDGLFVGVEHKTMTSYSGGGGAASTLELLRVSPAEPEAAKTVLALPIAASLMIRACFDEKDQYRRRNACHDEYSFDAKLSLDPKTAAGPPRLVVETEATTFPAGVSRESDSTTRGRLRERDLVTARDPACSYRRVMIFNQTTQAYAPDAPLPNCEAYTAP